MFRVSDKGLLRSDDKRVGVGDSKDGGTFIFNR